MIFAACASCLLAICLKKMRLAAGLAVANVALPNVRYWVEQPKTLAQFEFFGFGPRLCENTTPRADMTLAAIVGIGYSSIVSS
jgi:hypothetical protein